MNIIFKIAILFLTLNLVSCKGSAQEKDNSLMDTEFDFSTIHRFKESKRNSQIINDYEGLLTTSEINELSNILFNYNIKTSRQIVIVTIDNIDPYSDIQKFGSDLGDYWGVGTAEEDNGLLVLVSSAERKISIATGYGTEFVLTDEICKRVIDNVIIPELINGNYYQGIKKGVNELIEEWD